MEKTRKKSRKSVWLLPLLYALPVIFAVGAAIYLKGEDIFQLMGIAAKVLVIAP